MGNGLLDYYETTVSPSPNNPRRFYSPTPAVSERGLAGLFSDILTYVGVSTDWKKVLNDQIQSALIKVENQIGQFLSSGQTLVNIKAKADAQRNSSNASVASRAAAISANATALLSQFQNIQTQATQTINTLNSLKTQMASDPIFGFADPSQMGSSVLAAFNRYKGSLADAVAQTASVTARMAAHLKEVDSLNSDVNSLESMAQGKGISGLVSGFGSSFASGLQADIKPVLIIATIGLGAYLLLPSFLPRIAKGYRKARA